MLHCRLLHEMFFYVFLKDVVHAAELVTEAHVLKGRKLLGS